MFLTPERPALDGLSLFPDRSSWERAERGKGRRQMSNTPPDHHHHIHYHHHHTFWTQLYCLFFIGEQFSLFHFGTSILLSDSSRKQICLILFTCTSILVFDSRLQPLERKKEIGCGMCFFERSGLSSCSYVKYQRNV